MPIEVTINGKKEMIEKGATIRQVLEKREIRPEMVAIEVNGQVVDREEYTSWQLNPGDEVEFLYYMAGGRGGSRLKAEEAEGSKLEAI